MDLERVRAVVAPTITVLPQDCRGTVLLTGSHAGRYTGLIAAGLGLKGVVFHDAGIGLADAGVAALPLLDEIGLPAAAVSHRSSRIGDPGDMRARGVISRVNEAGQRMGATAGMTCVDVLRAFESGPLSEPVLMPHHESRHVLTGVDGGKRRLVVLDSAALVEAPVDAGAIVVTASHGGLVGGDPTKALKVDAFAAVFNDAGVGVDQAGIARLDALQSRGVAALTVDCMSARIGEGFSTLGGIVSHINRRAGELGARTGQPVAEIVLDWLAD